jgi:NAD(P)-dependent dehydrogenase (short-subunit alcohol dehydrogenase family)
MMNPGQESNERIRQWNKIQPKSLLKQSLQDKWQAEPFDFLVNNAGIGVYAPFAETTEEQFDTLRREPMGECPEN